MAILFFYLYAACGSEEQGEDQALALQRQGLVFSLFAAGEWLRQMRVQENETT